MRITTAIVLTCCLVMSNATFRLLKSRDRKRHQIQPIEGYRALDYLATPVVIPVPLPATVSTFNKHVATHTVSAQAPPIPAYAAAAAALPAHPVPVYPQTLAVEYSAPPVVDYGEPYTDYIETPSYTLFCL